MGMTGWSVSIACNTTFINHGCTDAEINAEWVKDLYVNDDVGDYPRFSPFLTRRGEIAGVLAQATRDIQVGEEIVCDYRSFRSYDDDDAELEELLERICDHGVGLVSSDDSTEEGQESAQTTRGSEHEPDEL
jgi:SET domain-containing protein